MKKRVLLWFAALAAAIVLFIGIYRIFAPKVLEGTKAYVVEVTDSAGTVKEYTGKTDAEFLSDLMDELVNRGGFTYTGSTTEYGLYIESINGETADYATDGAYWAIYVNGDYGQYGADQQPVNDGDTYGFVYEKQ